MPDADVSGVIQIFMDAYGENIIKGTISKVYRSFIAMKKTSTRYVSHRWEKEAGITISEEDWSQMWKNVLSTTNSLTWRDFGWKNLIRFFITSKQKSKISGSGASCWRECGEVAAGCFHVFWSCPKLKTFWEEIKQLVLDVLEVTLDFSFSTMYLGNIHEDINKRDSYLLKIIMVACKKAITKCWLQTSPPTRKLVIDIINTIHHMELITFSLLLTAAEGERRETLGKMRSLYVKRLESDTSVMHTSCKFV